MRQEQLLPPASASIENARHRYNLRDLAAVGFVLTVVVLLLGGVLGYVNAHRLTENERMVTHTHEVIREMEALLSSLKDAESGQRGYLLTEDEKYLQPYDDAVGRVQAEVTHLKELTSDNRAQQARLAAMERKIAAKLDELKRTVALMKEGDHAAALKIVLGNSGKALMDGVRDAVAVMQKEEHKLLRQRAEESEASSRILVLSILLPVVVGVVLVVVVFSLSQRNITERQRAAEVLAEQRERLRVTLASIGDAVLASDKEGRVTYLNAVAESLTGWKQDQATGQPLDVVFHIVNEQTRNRVDNPAKRVLREGVIVGLANHTVLIGRDGTERPIDDSAAPIRDGQGRMVGCVLVFRDITERRRLERQNAERLAASCLLASIVESSEDAIISKSLEGIIQSWNTGAQRLFGYTEEQVIGSHISIIIPADRVDEEEQILAWLRAGKRVNHFDTVRARSDGQLVDVSLTVSPIRDEAGRFVGASKIARDITDRKQAEQRTYGLMTELKDADRRKDEFLAVLAHELRGPLAPLRNMLEIMKRAESNGDLLEQARSTMERQLGQLVRLVDDLIDVSRITRDKIELRKERVELASVIYQSVETCRPLAESANHQVNVTLPPEPIYLDADPVRLAQVFGNILNNAYKYTEPGGRIWVTSEREGSDIVVKVKDTGIGIPPDKLGGVFEMFTQIDRSLERSQGGLGIGLTLVKRLVEMHGGSVEASSEGPGRGSEFVVRLPVLIENPKINSPEPASEPTTTPRRILIVDDNTDAASSLATLLKLTGNETRTAQDGLQAVEAAEQFRPDVVLLDIGLPKLSGYDACRRIREQPWGKKIMMVALTGWGQDDDRRKSQDAGFHAHMVKPVDYSALMKLLSEREAANV